MKKLIVVMLVALLAVALVACGNDTTTTAKPQTTTSPDSGNTTVTTTTENNTTVTTAPITTDGTVTTTETPTTTEPTVTVEGIDLINNIDEDMLDYNVINANLSSDYNGSPAAFMFEDTHGSLNFQVALVINMAESPVGVYESLVTTFEDGTWAMNDEFSWKVYVDGVGIDIKEIDLFNNTTSGWIRIGLGHDFSFDNYTYDEDNLHEFDIKIEIYDSFGKVVYYAYLTDPEWNGGYVMEKPAKVGRIDAEDRPDNVTMVPVADITPISGPNAGQGEGYEKLFDNDYRSKICTGTNGEEGASIARFSSVKNLAGFSICNANDNSAFTGRTVVAFELYVSSDNETWELAYSCDGTDGEGNPIDKASVSTDYLERYYSFDDKSVEATYIKLVVNNGEMYQISDLLFWEG